jgi:hypothetical protein
MAYKLTIDGLVPETEVHSFSFGRDATEWNLVLPLNDLAPELMRAASEARSFERAQLTGDLSFALTSVIVASCSFSSDVIEISLAGTAA